MPQSEWVKDPDAVLDYKFDWKASTNGSGNSDWLGAAETIIAGFDITITPVTTSPLTEDSSARTDANTSVTVWLSGGLAGTEYGVTCSIVTDNATARKDDRTMMIKVEER
jgi:hypothetical protein